MILPVSLPTSPLPQNSKKLTILPLSDLHLPKPGSRLLLENRAFLDRVDFTVLMGDMVSCYATDAEYMEVSEFVARLNRPYTAVCGNHEWYFELFNEDSSLYGDVWAEASPSEKLAAIRKFQAFYGVKELWRSFESPLGHFVFLSLDDVEEEKQESLSDEQLDYLAGELKRAGDKPLFIFCHTPLMLRTRLDMVYYEEERTACVELVGELREALEKREAPSFWMSGHIHLHPDHPLFRPYRCGGNVWQIHCPDSWGYGRWSQSQWVPELYSGLFSRHLEIEPTGVSFVTHDHSKREDRESYRVDF